MTHPKSTGRRIYRRSEKIRSREGAYALRDNAPAEPRNYKDVHLGKRQRSRPQRDQPPVPLSELAKVRRRLARSQGRRKTYINHVLAYFGSLLVALILYRVSSVIGAPLPSA